LIGNKKKHFSDSVPLSLPALAKVNFLYCNTETYFKRIDEAIANVFQGPNGKKYLRQMNEAFSTFGL
jgi:hypothetical protein